VILRGRGARERLSPSSGAVLRPPEQPRSCLERTTIQGTVSERDYECASRDEFAYPVSLLIRRGWA
jgi:hypothetical protein